MLLFNAKKVFVNSNCLFPKNKMNTLNVWNMISLYFIRE